MLAEEKNATWQAHNNNTMVQQPSSCSLACCYPCASPSLFPFSLSSELPSITPEDANRSPEKQAADDGDVVETPPQSPTLQLFPVALVREDHDQDHQNASLVDDMMNKMEGEERENDSSPCMSTTTSNEKANECNNPFPYYHFI